jgi:hypothetical protein
MPHQVTFAHSGSLDPALGNRHADDTRLRQVAARANAA